MRETYTNRMGKSVKVDEVFLAWTSANLERMLKALPLKTNPIDRHFLLLIIVRETYKRRSEPEMRKMCKEIAEKHVAEFSGLAPALKKEMGGDLPQVPTFQLLSTLLTEDGDYEQAINVCKTAIKFGLGDGTQSGFEGRIERILKKKAA
jgi:hypothetical protein